MAWRPCKRKSSANVQMKSALNALRDPSKVPRAFPLIERALATLGTLGEFVPGFETSGWFGIGAPKNTPIEIIDKLNTEINAGLADPKVEARLGDLGGTVLMGSPADFGKLIADETEKWGKVIRAANIKAE
jgi:tripartite-type tricarboxylate transporter receptor subunit TctC